MTQAPPLRVPLYDDFASSLCVPTFQLGRGPFGGIQHRDTMRRVLARFARKAREGALGDRGTLREPGVLER